MKSRDVSDALRRIPLLADIPTGELARVAGSAHGSLRTKGARVFEEGSPAESCFVFVSGRGKVVISGSAGTEVILATAEPFELVGELALLDGSRRSAALVTMKASEIIEIPRSSFLALRSNRAFEDRLMRHVTGMLRRATERQRAMTYAAGDRVFWCLVGLGLRSGRRTASGIVVSPKPTQQELADMTGVARETVSRRLLDLEAGKRVRTTATSYILDARALGEASMSV